MKKLYTLMLITAVFAMFSCGSTKHVTNQSDTNVEANKIELPPNVNSNKYSKKRQGY